MSWRRKSIGNILPALLLFLDDDLGQHRAGDVLAALGVIDHELAALLHHVLQIVERHIGAGRGVVEPPVGVFLDDDWPGPRPRLRGHWLRPIFGPCPLKLTISRFIFHAYYASLGRALDPVYIIAAVASRLARIMRGKVSCPTREWLFGPNRRKIVFPVLQKASPGAGLVPCRYTCAHGGTARSRSACQALCGAVAGSIDRNGGRPALAEGMAGLLTGLVPAAWPPGKCIRRMDLAPRTRGAAAEPRASGPAAAGVSTWPTPPGLGSPRARPCRS